MFRRPPIALAVWFLAACSVPEAELTPEPAPASIYESPGPYPVGNRSLVLHDAARERTLRVEIWYPAVEGARAAAEKGQPAEDFAYGATEHTIYKSQLAQAPASTKRAHSALDAEIAGAQSKWPIAFFSHCMDCTRFSTFSIAERLASHGIAVAAPDHAGGTMFEHLAETSAALGPEFLEVRATDIIFVMDQVLAADGPLPAEIRGHFDPARAGVFGHSFGGATTGRVLNLDARPKAGLALAVPFANPIFPAVEMNKIDVPVFFLVAKEDNSITEVGNDFIRDNFAEATTPAWKAEVADAGHFSFTDICGIMDGYDAGCTDQDDRQTDPGEYFTYIDIALGKAIAQAYVTAFFAHTLVGEPQAEAFLTRAYRPDYVTIDVRP